MRSYITSKKEFTSVRVVDIILDTNLTEEERREQVNKIVQVYGKLEEDTEKSLTDRLGEAAKMSEGLDLKEGPGLVPTAITFHPADIGAKKMEKRILDQLEESSASKHLRSAAFEMALFGTGVMKGPFATDKEYPDWNDEGEYVPFFKTVRFVMFCL